MENKLTNYKIQPWFMFLMVLSVIAFLTAAIFPHPRSVIADVIGSTISKSSPFPYKTFDPPPVSFRGMRDRTNGTWQPFGNKISMEGYVYTVFYDDRTSLQSQPIIRLIGVAETKEINIFCVLRYPNVNKTDVIKAQRSDIGAGIGRHGKNFREFIYSCPLTTNRVPSTVGLTENEGHSPTFQLPIEVPITPKYQSDFGVCVSVTYWKRDPHAIVEWMELLKILGVSQVTIYNNSIHADTARIFAHYSNEGFVDFRQSHSFIPDPGELTLHMHMSPVINDCIYRNMYKFKKIIVTDLDEVIVPRTADNYKDMIRDLDRRHAGSPFYQYVFRNNYFFLDIPGEVISQPSKLITMRHRKKVEVSPAGYSIKSIIDPLACSNMHNHYCWRVTPYYKSYSKNLDVEPELALNQHYKRCHFAPEECKKLIAGAVADNILLRYKQNLTQNMEIQLKRLGFAPLR